MTKRPGNFESPLKRSGRRYSDRTLKILWGRAAGRCAMPNCRIELTVDATEYDPIVCIGDIAHIEAASDQGPRANRKTTTKQRDEYGNLILLCKNCHTVLDGQKNSNPVGHILTLKTHHEEWVRAALPERGRTTTTWRGIVLQGTHPIDLASCEQALHPDHLASSPLILSITPTGNDWSLVYDELKNRVVQFMGIGDSFDRRFAVFPLAHITTCISLGHLLTSRPRVRLHQYHRNPQHWRWSEHSKIPLLSAPKVPGKVNHRATQIAVCISLSASVRPEQIKHVVPAGTPIISMAAATPSTLWLQNETQLRRLAECAQQLFEILSERFPSATKWHMFFAGPAPAAVVVGMQLNSTMVPPVQLYEFNRTATPAYTPSIELKGSSV